MVSSTEERNCTLMTEDFVRDVSARTRSSMRPISSEAFFESTLTRPICVSLSKTMTSSHCSSTIVVNIFSFTPCWKIVRKSFSPSNSAIWREEENAPASNAPNEVALRRTPEPWVVTTWPLLSMSITELALVSSTSLFKAVEMKASSRSEMMRLVSCSMYALPSVYAPGKGYHLYTHITLRYIKSLENFIAACLHQVSYAANARGIVREDNHQGKVS